MKVIAINLYGCNHSPMKRPNTEQHGEHEKFSNDLSKIIFIFWMEMVSEEQDEKITQ
jgi:hypothetical protein